jgi:hypothetical protein
MNMANIEGVGTPITYSEDNAVQRRIREWRDRRWEQVRQPSNDQERLLLADWLGFRGRDEIVGIVGAATYAYTHFDMDMEWRRILSEHIEEECGHGWNFIQLGNKLDPTKDHTKPDPEFENRYQLGRRWNHWALITRDFLSYLFAGNLWIYGHVTATCRLPIISDERVVHYQRTDQLAGEEQHHYRALQKIHDHVWELIDRYGEAPVRKRIAEIDAEALNNNSRTLWDPPTRDFLLEHLGCTLEMTPMFFAWREYLYLNVLGFPPEPVTIREWPAGLPTALEAVAA